MSVQFSYPILGDSQSQGFFTYSDPATNKYVSFTPSSIAVKGNKLYIKHNITGSNVWVIFNLIPNRKAQNLYYTSKQIKLDNLIMAELNLKKSTFLNGNITYKYSDTEYSFASGTHVFEMPNSINVNNIESIGTAPDLSTANNSTTIPLTKSSFGSDDLICDESEVDTTPSTQTSSNTALNIGAVMLSAFVLMGCLMLVKKFKSDTIIFEANTGLLQGFESQKIYLIVTGIFFILSFALFISNGVKPNNYILMFALVFLVNTIIMMWFKVAVFTAANTTATTA